MKIRGFIVFISLSSHSLVSCSELWKELKDFDRSIDVGGHRHSSFTTLAERKKLLRSKNDEQTNDLHSNRYNRSLRGNIRKLEQEGQDGSYFEVQVRDIRFNKLGLMKMHGVVNNGPARRVSNDIQDETSDSLVTLSVSNELENVLPLTAKSYPLSENAAEIIRSETLGDSVVTEGDYEVKHDVHEILEASGVMTVTHPGDEEFWKELQQIAELQMHRRLGKQASEFMSLPASWSNYSLEDAAEAVHNEYPGLHQGRFIEHLVAKGIELDHDIIPRRSNVEVLHGPFMLAMLNTWAVSTVGPTSFCAKWAIGRARPEEIAWKISTGELTVKDGVPEDLVVIINLLELQSAEDFTAYAEGSPKHPSLPAMHSSASSLSLWLAVVLNLTDEQWHEAKLVDNAVAFARSIAGVHYVSDNVAGLNIGQEIIARDLPTKLQELYGSDPEKVKQKIDRLRFDWSKISL